MLVFFYFCSCSLRNAISDGSLCHFCEVVDSLAPSHRLSYCECLSVFSLAAYCACCLLAGVVLLSMIEIVWLF